MSEQNEGIPKDDGHHIRTSEEIYDSADPYMQDVLDYLSGGKKPKRQLYHKPEVNERIVQDGFTAPDRPPTILSPRQEPNLYRNPIFNLNPRVAATVTAVLTIISLYFATNNSENVFYSGQTDIKTPTQQTLPTNSSIPQNSELNKYLAPLSPWAQELNRVIEDRAEVTVEELEKQKEIAPTGYTVSKTKNIQDDPQFPQTEPQSRNTFVDAVLLETLFEFTDPNSSYRDYELILENMTTKSPYFDNGENSKIKTILKTWVGSNWRAAYISYLDKYLTYSQNRLKTSDLNSAEINQINERINTIKNLKSDFIQQSLNQRKKVISGKNKDEVIAVYTNMNYRKTGLRRSVA